jgi:hypothetical protein
VAGGSIVLGNGGNDFQSGSVTARSSTSREGKIDQPRFELGGQFAVKSEELPLLSRVELTGTGVELTGTGLNIGNSGATLTVPGFNSLGAAKIDVGIEADLVRLNAESIVTGANYMVARYSATRLRGVEYQLPGLAITMQGFSDQAFGAVGDRAAAATGNGPGLKVLVGYSAERETVGWVVSFPGSYDDPQGLADRRKQGALISLSGPVVNNRYRFAAPDVTSTVSIFYNMETPLSPGQLGALSSIDALTERLRREQIERSVSTENVSRDLREGVIVEVGAGPAATTGSEGIRLPQICAPAPGGLACPVPAK